MSYLFVFFRTSNFFFNIHLHNSFPIGRWPNLILTFSRPLDFWLIGLETLDYLENLSKRELLPEQADAITFEFEMDRTYLGLPKVVAVISHEWKNHIPGENDFQPRREVYKLMSSYTGFGDVETKQKVTQLDDSLAWWFLEVPSNQKEEPKIF
ncbi:hypothetical protein Bca52824_002367 [Brassica carinata]|uniref:Uncharacterized protein n=1 Tax=Brassica carinata TaxID=52824 RepID=A0A8X7WKN8_BRACI|nr:hypothetical protein Bca52824_002367 [Brassica carinata]